MEVTLLRGTDDPDRLVALAARRCYSSLPADRLEQRLSGDDVVRLLTLLRRRGHLSPFEHASFTFSVAGVSRVLSHQLVRHRLASYAQESQRYVEYHKGLPYVVPPTVAASPAAQAVYRRACDQALAAYQELLALGVKAEDARYVFPGGSETKLVFTFNARSLFNFFEQRCCRKAQHEIRTLALAMLQRCREVAPLTFATAGAPCQYPRPWCREDDETCPAHPAHRQTAPATAGPPRAAGTPRPRRGQKAPPRRRATATRARASQRP